MAWFYKIWHDKISGTVGPVTRNLPQSLKVVPGIHLKFENGARGPQ